MTKISVKMKLIVQDENLETVSKLLSERWRRQRLSVWVEIGKEY